jgi:HAD superfamily hydrolase (TIGR01509 family)
MDGVLTDSEPLYHEALNVILASQGHQLSEEDNRQILGTTVEHTWSWVMGRFRLTGTLEDWKGRYSAVVRRLLEEKVTPAPGVYRLMDEVERRGLKRAVASSSERVWVETVLNKLGLLQRFQVTIAGEDVTRGKPDPQMYLMAARALGVSPQQCLVIEDSPVGLKAAKAAGMMAVAVLTPSTRHLDLSHADVVIGSLEEFDYSLLD